MRQGVRSFVSNQTMRYRLRTVLYLLAIGPPLLAGAWFLGSGLLALMRDWRTAANGGGVRLAAL